MSKKPRITKGRLRGTPPPATFSLAALPDDAVLTQAEVAAIRRQSLVSTERRRNAGTDGLTWRYVEGRPRCIVESLKRVMQGDPTKRLRSPRNAESQTKSRAAANVKSHAHPKLAAPDKAVKQGQ